LSERASRLYVRSGACGDLCHDTPCWPWFVHWLSVRWTTATRFSLVSLASCKTGCSPSWMSPTVGFLSEAVRTHNPIASWDPLVASSRASYILAVRSGLPLSSWNSADVPCWGPSPDIWCRHSTPSAFCWHSHAGGTVHQTFNAQRPCLHLHVRGTACRRPSRMHRRWRRSVVNWRLYFPSRRLTMIRRSWLYCTV